MTSDNLPEHEEHERRFLVDDLSVLEGTPHQEIKRACPWAEGGYAVRVRLKRSPNAAQGARAFLTLKGPRDAANPYVGHEVEQDIDPHRAETVVRNAQYVVIKRRYAVTSGSMTFDVDAPLGKIEELVIAEFEGTPKVIARMSHPWFANKEVTRDRRCSNDRLAISLVTE